MKERDCCCDAENRKIKLLEAFLSLTASQKEKAVKKAEEIHSRRSL